MSKTEKVSDGVSTEEWRRSLRPLTKPSKLLFLQRVAGTLMIELEVVNTLEVSVCAFVCHIASVVGRIWQNCTLGGIVFIPFFT